MTVTGVGEGRLREMVAAAKEASGRAYCPYSNFPVGAAVLLEDGSVHAACNVENAAYGPSMCAERSAVFKAVSERGPGVRVLAAVVYTPTSRPTSPCGPCRQVLSEFGPDALVVCVCDGEEELRTDLTSLLPHPFCADGRD